MADQKAMKKRLKALMSLPENQICSDCNERQPRWASLIVPPPGAPSNSLAIGAFCCLECSGSHRRLGVHISFVRSINLDSCMSLYCLFCFLRRFVSLFSFLSKKGNNLYDFGILTNIYFTWNYYYRYMQGKKKKCWPWRMVGMPK